MGKTKKHERKIDPIDPGMEGTPKKQKRGPTGRCLCIGLNSVNPKFYDGWEGTLNACENDAKDMEKVARSCKFTDTKILLTKNATKDAVVNEIKRLAKDSIEGDIVLLTYSGHGGQVPDKNKDEIDDRDETWVLYDYQLVDDELFALLTQFKAGVRVLVFSDSCHSGTVTKDEASVHYEAKPNERFKNMPGLVAVKTFITNKEYYESILPKQFQGRNAIQAMVILISGCQDHQLSLDGFYNGLFTEKMLRVWNGGTFKGNYRQFHKAILRSMPPNQSPNFSTLGNTATFEAEKPFFVK